MYVEERRRFRSDALSLGTFRIYCVGFLSRARLLSVQKRTPSTTIVADLLHIGGFLYEKALSSRCAHGLLHLEYAPKLYR